MALITTVPVTARRRALSVYPGSGFERIFAFCVASRPVIALSEVIGLDSVLVEDGATDRDGSFPPPPPTPGAVEGTAELSAGAGTERTRITDPLAISQIVTEPFPTPCAPAAIATVALRG